MGCQCKNLNQKKANPRVRRACVRCRKKAYKQRCDLNPQLFVPRTGVFYPCAVAISAAGRMNEAVVRKAGASTLEQGQHGLWQLVGLSHHGSACLLQDLRAREVGGFLCKVGVLNA
jgi:hypothetical protein